MDPPPAPHTQDGNSSRSHRVLSFAATFGECFGSHDKDRKDKYMEKVKDKNDGEQRINVKFTLTLNLLLENLMIITLCASNGFVKPRNEQRFGFFGLKICVINF